VVENAEEAEDLMSLVPAEESEREKTIAAFRKQALVMIAGRQDDQRELSYLIDGLRTAYGLPMRNGTTLSAEDLVQIDGLKRAFALGKAKSKQRHTEAETPDFKKLLHEHATGFLAPLIKNLEVRWPADILSSGLTLVDLPGVGVAGDVHARVTEEYIREKAKGVLLVVSSRGVTNEEADLLQKTGFLSRLLHAADDPGADPLTLMVVVTHADDIASERYKQDKSRKKADHFIRVRAESELRVRSQIREELEKVWRSTKGEISETKGEVLERLLKDLQVHVVSAPEYQRLILKDLDDPPFIRTEEESGIPILISSLRDLASSGIETRETHLNEEGGRFFRRLRARLGVFEAQWQDQTRAEQLAVKLDTELKQVAEPLRKDFSNRQGAFREFLQTTLPTIIEKVVIEAGVEAHKEIYAYMKGLKGAHWKTLQAAVRRGGTFYGSRHINLPHDFALKFEEPIAEKWGKILLRGIRKRTQEYAEDSVELIEQILQWARQHGAKPKTALLEALVEVIKADAQKLNAVGKEALEELRENVKNTLIKRVEGPIRRKCEKFVEKNQDIGFGVKLRILDLFSELADETIKAATEPAIILLTQRFKEVEQEIRKVFDEHQEHRDPVSAAITAIVAQYEARARKIEKKEREAVLANLKEIETSSPIQWDTAGQETARVQ
jgi:hypothetical protein